MAFDPTYQNIIEQFGQSYFFQEMKGQTEREIKLCIGSDSKVIPLPNQSNNFAIQRGALAIKALFADLEQHGIWHDKRGIIPNDYVLASLNLDTIQGSVPTARHYSEGWQLRIRFPLYVHEQETEFDYSKLVRQMDANMKTFLSSDATAHRTELEQTVDGHPSEFFRDFKRATRLPAFTKEVRDEHLRVTDICLTSRTGFYVVMKDPQSDAHVLLHGTYDASKFVTSNVFTNDDLRLEIELEAKGLFTKNNVEFDVEQQDKIVNRVFETVIDAASQHKLSPFSLSKIEDSMMHADKFYKERVGNMNRFAKHLDRNNVAHSGEGLPSLQRLYAIAVGETVRGTFCNLKEKGFSAPITVLAQEMPAPKDMLDSVISAPLRALA